MKRRTKKHESRIRYKNFDYNVLKDPISPNNVFAMSEIRRDTMHIPAPNRNHRLTNGLRRLCSLRAAFR